MAANLDGAHQLGMVEEHLAEANVAAEAAGEVEVARLDQDGRGEDASRLRRHDRPVAPRREERADRLWW
jgi:hypothetical protein